MLISKLSIALFYITALAIMQDFRDNEKKHLKMTASWPFCILLLQNLSWVILVGVLTFCSMCMVQLCCFVFELRIDITDIIINQIQNDRYTAILKLFAPKS